MSYKLVFSLVDWEVLTNVPSLSSSPLRGKKISYSWVVGGKEITLDITSKTIASTSFSMLSYRISFVSKDISCSFVRSLTENRDWVNYWKCARQTAFKTFSATTRPLFNIPCMRNGCIWISGLVGKQHSEYCTFSLIPVTWSISLWTDPP